MESETEKSQKPSDVIAQPMQPKAKAAWLKATTKKVCEKQRYPVKVEAHPEKEKSLTVTADNDGTELIGKLYETTGITDIDGAGMLITQVINAVQNDGNPDSANAALAMMNGIAPENPLEGLLSAQMTVAHSMAMEFSRRAMKEGQTTEGVDRNINRVTKMMRTFTTQAEALQKLRNKGQQKITVQHVQVNHGGQAVIGDVNQGGQTR